MSDIRFAVRTLSQQKGWTAVVLLSLALGIGVNTALFSAVKSLFLDTIAVSDPHSLVRLRSVGDNEMATDTREYGFFGRSADGRRLGATFSHPTFLALRDANETLTGLLAASPLGRVNVSVDGRAEIASGFIATGNYFELLGIRAAAGRLIGADDDRPEAPPAVVISYPYWKQRFGLAEDAIGTVVTVNGLAATVVGVTDEGYAGIQTSGASPPDVHLPLSLNDSLNGTVPMTAPTFLWLEVMGRLKPGVTAEQVRGNLNGVFQAAMRSGLDAYLGSLTDVERRLSRNRDRTAVPSLVVESGSRGVYDPRASVERDSQLLGAVVGLLLLIVCANVANLLLSRAAARRPEIAVRLAMGATRSRLIRQLILESLLLAVFGGVAGVAVAFWTRRLLPHGQDAPLDAGVLLFVGVLSAVTAVACSLAPALRATGIELSESLKQSARSARARRPLSRALLVVQVALSLAILTGAGLFLNTLRNLRSVDVGFDPTNVLLFRLDPRLSGYEDERMPLFFEQVRERIASLPGVRSASFSRISFLTGSSSTRTAYFAEGEDQGTDVNVMIVSPEFFETLDVRLLTGRVFGDSDRTDSPAVAVFNLTAAREFFGRENAVSERFGFSPEERREVEIVGVVSDVKYRSVRDEAPPTVYVPHRQSRASRMVFEVKTFAEPRAVLPAVRRAVSELDSNVPLIDVTTQEEQIEQRFRQERAFAVLYSLFGILAMVLAAVGLFGLASYDIVRRTKEIGIRIALGAGRSRIVYLVLGDTLRLVALGVGLGLVVVLAGGRWISSWLFGVAPTDLATMGGAAVVLVVAATLAGYFPARRAARTEPTVALQHE